MGKSLNTDQLTTLLHQVADDVALIKKHLATAEVSPRPELLTVEEWCKAAKCSRWVWEVLKTSRLIQFQRRGRKILIPSHTAIDYLEGRLTLPPLNQ